MPRKLLQLISGMALAGTILPPLMFLLGSMTLDASKNWMLAATVAWFVITPLWMGNDAQTTEVADTGV